MHLPRFLQMSRLRRGPPSSSPPFRCCQRYAVGSIRAACPFPRLISRLVRARDYHAISRGATRRAEQSIRPFRLGTPPPCPSVTPLLSAAVTASDGTETPIKIHAAASARSLHSPLRIPIFRLILREGIYYARMRNYLCDKRYSSTVSLRLKIPGETILSKLLSPLITWKLRHLPSLERNSKNGR